jgi:Flp pilus assembly pilin Flp
MKIDISRIQVNLKRIALADCGQSMTEYALLCALVAFGATAGYRGMATSVANAYNTISADFAGVFGSASGGNSGGNGGGNNGGGDNGGGNGGNGGGGNGGGGNGGGGNGGGGNGGGGGGGNGGGGNGGGNGGRGGH